MIGDYRDYGRSDYDGGDYDGGDYDDIDYDNFDGGSLSVRLVMQKDANFNTALKKY